MDDDVIPDEGIAGPHLPTEAETLLLQQEIEAALKNEAEEAARVEAHIASVDFTSQFDAANRHVDEQIKKAEEYHVRMVGARNLTPESINAACQPAELTGCVLRDYQLEGMQFCAKRYLSNESLILAGVSVHEWVGSSTR